VVAKLPLRAFVRRPLRKGWLRTLIRDRSGQSLVETAAILSVATVLIIYAVDFGYFFIVAANLTSSARNATQYSIQGFQTAGQSSLPSAGPPNTSATVGALALADLGGLLDSSTVTAITVCSKGTGTSGNYVDCTSYSNGSGSKPFSPTTSLATEADPEAPAFYSAVSAWDQARAQPQLSSFCRHAGGGLK
jgi:Flp pilus assembly protein TadG